MQTRWLRRLILVAGVVMVIALSGRRAGTASATSAACFRNTQTGSIVCVDLQGNVMPPLVLQAMPQNLTSCLVDRFGLLFCPVSPGSVVFTQVLVRPVVVPVLVVRHVVFIPTRFHRIHLRPLVLARCVRAAAGMLFCR